MPAVDAVTLFFSSERSSDPTEDRHLGSLGLRLLSHLSRIITDVHECWVPSAESLLECEKCLLSDHCCVLLVHVYCLAVAALLCYLLWRTEAACILCPLSWLSYNWCVSVSLSLGLSYSIPCQLLPRFCQIDSEKCPPWYPAVAEKFLEFFHH